MMREAFLYQAALKVLDWILDDAWPRALVVVPLVLPLALVKRLLQPNMSKRKERASRTTGLSRGRTTPNMPTWGRWVVGCGSLVVVGGLGWLTLDVYHFRTVASGLTLYTAEFYQALCLGMKTAGLTGMTAHDVLRNAPNIQKLPYEAQLDIRRQAILELQHQAIIRKDIPMQTHPLGVVTQDVVPTPLGQQLCAYYLTISKSPQKAQ